MSLLFSFLYFINCISAQDSIPNTGTEFLVHLSFEEFLNTKITTGSRIEESILNASGAIIVLTEKEIKERGYTELLELLLDLPGFDHSVVRGEKFFTSWQRGYRTPSFQRTLLLINGIECNNIWSHETYISRQHPINLIERVEILYGPASAIYGANAFLGVINVITKKGNENLEDTHFFNTEIQGGSYNTIATEITAHGRFNKFAYAVGGKLFFSDGPGLDDISEWGYTQEDWLANKDVWGPILNFEHNDVQLGKFANKAKNYGLFGELYYNGFTLGTNLWSLNEANGFSIAFDRTQPNQPWIKRQSMFYLRHQKEVSSKFKFETLIKYQTNRTFGTWVEAIPDWEPGNSQYSYISMSDWNSYSSLAKLRHDFKLTMSNIFHLNGGGNLALKRPTKNYEIANYWSDYFCPNCDPNDQGPYGLGPGIYHSTDPIIERPYTLSKKMPGENRYYNWDAGLYLQGVAQFEKLRYTLAVRYDYNDMFGSFIKPRFSIIYTSKGTQALKLIYSSAFQEPAPRQLYAGWTGRIDNPDMIPEEVQNIEFIYMKKWKNFITDVSLYNSFYKNVIKEEAENAGKRNIKGVEIRNRFQIRNPIVNDSKINAYLYYTYTKSMSAISYDFENREWIEQENELGDIAPHKIQAGINWPIRNNLKFNLSGLWNSSRKIYLRNPLRNQGEMLESFTIVNTNVRYELGKFYIAFKINNLLNTEYYHPGVSRASSGNQFTDDAGNPLRSGGFQNSLIPQAKRNFLLVVGINIH